MNCLATAKTRTEGADSEVDGGLEGCSQSTETKDSNIKLLQTLNTEETRDPARSPSQESTCRMLDPATEILEHPGLLLHFS